MWILLGVIWLKFREVLFAVLPVLVVVLLLNFTLAPLGFNLLIKFAIGAGLIIAGLTLFLFGVEIGVGPIGNLLGSAIVKSNKTWVVLTAGLLLGFFISIAEPDLHIVAGQVEMVTAGGLSKYLIIVVVSVGIGTMLSAGLLRIARNFPLYLTLLIVYGVVLILGFFTSREMLAIAFDASGATTGAMTVPFFLALALGISAMKKDSKAAEKDSFGLVATVSAGAIIAVMLMSILLDVDMVSEGIPYVAADAAPILSSFLTKLPFISQEVALALLPILLIFLVLRRKKFKVKGGAFRKILFGLLYAYLGLTMFLLGANAGFIEVGNIIGYKVALIGNNYYIIVLGFFLGLVTVVAEPAVHILTQQVETVTSGYVSRKIVLATLAVSIALAIALSMVRILVPPLQLWHFLLPGYALALLLTFVAPKLFVGIAFDAGGVASGPMTATFILAFAHGAAEAVDGANVLVDGFGIIAMVAMMPLITLQIIGIVYKIKSSKKGFGEDGRERRASRI
jgi:hypothetical protein